MSEELKKQIEICEKIVDSKGNICDDCIYDRCPLYKDGEFDCNDEKYGNNNKNKPVNAAKAFLAKNKPVISRDELIEKCKGKVFSVGSEGDWDACVERCKSLSVKDCAKSSFDGYDSLNHSYFAVSYEYGFNSIRHSEIDDVISMDKVSLCGATEFLSFFKPSVTIDKNVTSVDNPSVKLKLPNPDLTSKLNKREMILKNKKDVVEVCDKSLKCEDETGLLCKYCPVLKKYEYFNIPHTVEQLGRVSEWYLNLEKVVK